MSGSGEFRARFALQDLAIRIARQRVPGHHAADALPAPDAFGCWDWWGYEGEDYATRDGRQIRAVRAMIADLLGEGPPAP